MTIFNAHCKGGTKKQEMNCLSEGVLHAYLSTVVKEKCDVLTVLYI